MFFLKFLDKYMFFILCKNEILKMFKQKKPINKGKNKNIQKKLHSFLIFKYFNINEG